MNEFLSSVGCFILYGLIDYVIFLIIDFQFGCKIENASSSQEKRNHWLIEACILVVISFLIQCVSHWPFVLYLLAIIIVIYALFKAPPTLTECIDFLDIGFRAVYWYCEKLIAYLQRQYRLWKRKNNSNDKLKSSGTNNAALDSSVRKRLVDYLQSRLEATNVDETPCQRSGANTMIIYLKRPFQSILAKLKYFQEKCDESDNSLIQPNASMELAVLQPCGLACIEHGYGSAARGGNLCFLYSVLQCLFHSEGFVKLMLRKCVTSRHEPILQSCCILLKQVYSPELYRPVVNVCTLVHHLSHPRALSHLIGSQRSSDRTSAILTNNNQRQQDAAEFFFSFINLLHDLSKVDVASDSRFWPEHLRNKNLRMTADEMDQYIQANKQNMENCRGNDLNEIIASFTDMLLENAELRLYQYRADDQCSHIRNFFELLSTTLVLCPACQRVRVVTERLLVLPVALPDSPNTDSKNLAEIDLSSRIRDSYNKIEYFHDLSCVYCKYEPSVDHGDSQPSDTESSPIMNCSPHYSPRTVLSPINCSLIKQSTSLISDNTFKRPSTSTPISRNANKSKPNLLKSTLKKPFQKRVVFSHQPKVLVLQLMRFRFDRDTNSICKNRYPVIVPADGFSLARSVTLNQGQIVYQLSGLVVHAGDMIHGHYISLCRHAATGQWYRMDDEKVTHLRDGVSSELNSDWIKRNAYLLFYSRQN